MKSSKAAAEVRNLQRRRRVATVNKALPAPKPDKAALAPRPNPENLPGQLTTTRDGEFCFTEEGFKATANAFRSGEGKHGIDDKTLVLLCQATGAFPLARDSNRGLVNSTTIQLMQSLAPRDGLEVLLCTQMIGMHNLAMEFMRRASQRDQTNDGVDANVARSTRCSRTFAALTEALRAKRAGGQQKVEVRHVHVNAGGQAIVADTVTHTGGGVGIEKKSEQ